MCAFIERRLGFDGIIIRRRLVMAICMLRRLLAGKLIWVTQSQYQEEKEKAAGGEWRWEVKLP